jgi:hypothetical protein
MFEEIDDKTVKGVVAPKLTPSTEITKLKFRIEKIT